MLKKHRPPHYFPDRGVYFITCGTYQKKPLFDNDEKKTMLKTVIGEKSLEFNVKIFAFAIMANHYHLLLKADDNLCLPEFIKNVNGKSAHFLNKMDKLAKRKLWYSYWDTRIRGEEDFWVRFNYIHHNPVKHGAVARMEDYEFSSYRGWLTKKSKEWMADILEAYPIVDFTKGDE